MREIKLYKSKNRALKLLFGGGAFVAIGFFIMDKNPFAAWAGILFFGLGIIVGLFHLFDKRPQIIINELGIFDRTTLKDFINWEIINDAYLIDIYNQKFICLVVDKEYKPSNKKNDFYKLAVKLNEKIGAQELNIALGQIDIDPNDFLQFIIEMKNAEGNNKTKLILDGIKHYR
ncbi:STM3941 family protein [Flavobacterium suncheonense]|uniref:STM3941 family protein n=1 Tax=Flavobacterium suncheonense TaxID=350894 RepID=UPI00040B06B7|nr:STM3941 family protein [Flavobacterium suncheonense]